MLPKKELNIYPKSEENFKALISFYFDSYEIDLTESIDFLNSKTSYSLNQIEYVLRKISEAYKNIFRENLKGKITLTNLMQYGFESLTVVEKDWRRSQSGKKIMKLFLNFVKKTEIDINFLETNN
jgi:hypothetical protein